MDRPLKISLYVLFLGALTFGAALWGTSVKQEYSSPQVLGRKSGLELIIEPAEGREPLLQHINSARKEVLVEVYLLSDREIISSLKEAENRGVTVKVMLEEHPFGGGNLNATTLPELTVAGIATRWANPVFTLTHEKALVIDGQTTCILDQNLTTSAFTKNREYDVCDDNPAEVAEVEHIFNADWVRGSYVPNNTNLVVSPDNARDKITALLKSAAKSVDIEIEVLQDPAVVKLLVGLTTSRIVRVILPPAAQISGSQGVIDELRRAGIEVRTLTSPYPHAKLIIVDNNHAYTGSVNLSAQSLDQNRELGLLISEQDIIDRLSQQFDQDFEKAR